MKLAIRLACDSLRNHKLRSRLSTVGIVISVFLVSLIFIISDSLKANIQHQADNLNKDTIIINGATSDSLLNLNTAIPRDTLTNADADRVNQCLIDEKEINSNLILTGNIRYSQRELNDINTIATTITNPELLGIELAHGSWLDGDNQAKQWVILGEDLANQLIGTNEPLNQVVEIKGTKFTVVGVIKQLKQPLSLLGYNIDKSAFISLANGQRLIGSDRLSQIIVSNIKDVNQAKTNINQSLIGAHADSSDYSIDTSSGVAERLTELVNYLTIAACSLAVIILIVSSISIANIMLVNVVERRREIGIRKAVGANTANIMGQFVIESLIMSIRGGIIGLILAYAVAAIALLFMSMSVTFSWLALGVGFITPIIVGVIAGIYPAYRAARQDIIEALNQLT